MPTLKRSTSQSLKIKLLDLMGDNPQSTFYFSVAIQRSWGYTMMLLNELVKERKIKKEKIANLIVWRRGDEK